MHAKRCISGALAVAAVAAAFGTSLLVTAPALANTPTAGVLCQADGKIDGRGATTQAVAVQDFLLTFDQDVCGAVGGATTLIGSNVGVYNSFAPTSPTNYQSSGEGLDAVECRTDDWAGSDLPYTQAQLATMDGPPSSTSTCAPGGADNPGTELYPPDSTTNSLTFPNASDETASVMSFPIAGTSAAIPINLTTADCSGSTTGVTKAIAFTPTQVSYLFGGNAATWNDPVLTAGNPWLAACNSSTAVTRVVRSDTDTATTQYLKNYLKSVDNTRTLAPSTCDASETWSATIGTSANNTWPDSTGTNAPGTGHTVAAGSGCSALEAQSNNSGVISGVTGLHGAVGYADLANEAAVSSSVITASVQNASGTAYESPAVGTTANCDYSALTLPGGGSPEGAMGLLSSDNWGWDNATANPGTGDHTNATDLGTKYPICGLSFDLVFSGLSGGSSSALSQLTPDQDRTLYSFFTYVLSSTAQQYLPQEYYASLPQSWLPFLQGGFQSEF